MNIFLSYGHDSFAKLAERLKNDLSNLGHSTWFDIDKLRSSVDWQNKIESAILESDWLIILMTAHSVRRPDGVCLDEVSLARYNNKRILPIMLQRVAPPFCIVRLQYMDLETLCCADGDINEELYQKKLHEIIEILNGSKTLSCEGVLPTLHSCLDPLDNDVYFSTFKSGFTGRDWLFEKYDAWVKNDASKLFILLGKPGTGKSAFAANLSIRRGEVCGIHFCKYNNSDRADPKRVIMSLAYHLASQIPEYAEALVRLNDISLLKEKSVQRLFEYIFTEPLAKIEWRKEPIVLVIDALDEADSDGKNALMEVIANCFNQTKSWLKLLVTARPEADIVRKFKKFEPTVVEKYEENDQDIYEYLKKKLSLAQIPYTEREIEKLALKCQGSFLYANEILKDIVDARLTLKDIDSFPQGMTEKYVLDFERLFSDTQSYKDRIVPILEVLVAQQMPLTIAEISCVFDADENDIEEIYEEICTLFPKENNFIMPLHKSLYDWLINREMAGKYTVSAVKGHKTLCHYYNKFFERGKLTNKYAVKFLAKHNIYSKDFEFTQKILTAKEWQNERTKLLGLDTSLRSYLMELYLISQMDVECAQELMTNSLFKEMLIINKSFFCNSGLFFQIMDCGFDEVVPKIEKDSADIISVIAHYYYTTERFKNAESLFIDAIEKLECIENPREQDLILLARAYNYLGLSNLKRANFNEATCWFNKAADKALEVSFIEYACAKINLCSIEFHKLNFEGAEKLGELSLSYLEKCFDGAASDDEKKSLNVFVAEYQRLIAVSALWKPQLELARKHLNAIKNIYDQDSTRARNYYRYQYSEMLYQILSGNACVALEIAKEILPEVRSSGDRMRVLFFKSFAEFCVGNKECENDYNQALAIAEKLNVPLEIAEIKTLRYVCSGVPTENTGNLIVDSWCKHIMNVINDTKSNYRQSSGHNKH